MQTVVCINSTEVNDFFEQLVQTVVCINSAEVSDCFE